MKTVPLLLALVVAPLAQSADLAPTGTLRASFIENNPNQGRVDPKATANAQKVRAERQARRTQNPEHRTQN